MISYIKNKVQSLLSSDQNKRIFTHSFWILTGNIAAKFSLLLATIVMARFMVKEEYGQFGVIKSTILTFAVFAGLELGMTATKYISQYKNTDPKKIERIVGLSNLFAIVLSLLIGALVILFSQDIANQIAAPALATEIKISSFILFFSSLNGLQVGVLNGLERFKETSINNAIAGVVSSILLILAAMFFDLSVVVLAFGSNFVILFLLNYVSIKKYFYKDYVIGLFKRENFKELPVIWRFSLPAILAGIMVGPVIWLCNYFLVNQPDGYAQMALFDIANQWRATILFIPAALSQIVLPLLSASLNDKESYKSLFRKNIKVNVLIGVAFFVILTLLTPVLVWLYGEEYADATSPMIIMFATTVFISINNVIGQAIASQDKMWLGFFVNTMWAIVLLVATYILVVSYQLGAIGVSLAYLISYVFHTLVQFIYIKKIIDKK